MTYQATEVERLGLVTTDYLSSALANMGGDNPAVSLPAGIIVMWAGLIANIPSGWNLCDGQNGTPDLRSKFIKGAAGEAGGTGGSATHTPSGTVSAPTFTGSALGTHAHGAGTLVPSAHAGATVGDHSAISAHSGTAVGTSAAGSAHSHTYTQVIDHVHVERAQGGTTGSTTGTHLMTSAATGGSLRSAAQSTLNPTGSVGATGTSANESAHTHAAGTVTQPDNHSAISSHSVGQANTHTMSGTSEAVSAGTPAGTISTPTFTGSSQNTEPAYYELCFIQKAA